MSSLASFDPGYDRTALRSRIVHLGFGAFHRAHQGVYSDDVARGQSSDWGTCVVSLFSDGLIGALRNQDHLYTVAAKGPEGMDLRVVGSVVEGLSPRLDGIEAVIEKMAEPQVAIISLTITEKGYCIDPATGVLDHAHPGVQADLRDPLTPTTALGFIVQALALRRARGLAPVSVLSCDNIQGNGAVARAAVLAYAKLLDRDLADWIGARVTFPATMVDRIVPAVTPDTHAEIAEKLGVDDPCAISCEPFSQWVIEDNFAAGRPDWDIAGAQFVDDVGPYEEMKLRMLNGSHSFLAYLGYLAGYDHIAETMADPDFRRAARALMLQDQAPTLDMPTGTDLTHYADDLIARFENPALKHRTWQIAMDGSQKIPQRFGGAIRYHLQQGRGIGGLALGIAGWMRYVSGVDETGEPIDVRDPMAAQLRAICDQNPPDVVPALLSLTTIFDPEIGQSAHVRAAVTTAYQSLIEHGAKTTVARWAKETSS